MTQIQRWSQLLLWMLQVCVFAASFIFYFEKIKDFYEITLLSVHPTPTFFVCVFVTVRKCLLSCCIATSVSSGSTILAFRCHATLHSEVVQWGAFCAVYVMSDTQYVVRGKWVMVLPGTSCYLKGFHSNIRSVFCNLWHFSLVLV
jgi:hypothetical protein